VSFKVQSWVIQSRSWTKSGIRWRFARTMLPDSRLYGLPAVTVASLKQRQVVSTAKLYNTQYRTGEKVFRDSFKPPAVSV
jgi:hypothetical protein